MIAHWTQIIVAALGTFPSYAEYWWLLTKVAHCTFVLYAGRWAIHNTQIIGAHATIIGGGAVVPDDHHLFARFEIAHSPQVTFAAILERRLLLFILHKWPPFFHFSTTTTNLLAPFPVGWVSHHSCANTAVRHRASAEIGRHLSDIRHRRCLFVEKRICIAFAHHHLITWLWIVHNQGNSQLIISNETSILLSFGVVMRKSLGRMKMIRTINSWARQSDRRGSWERDKQTQ